MWATANRVVARATIRQYGMNGVLATRTNPTLLTPRNKHFSTSLQKRALRALGKHSDVSNNHDDNHVNSQNVAISQTTTTTTTPTLTASPTNNDKDANMQEGQFHQQPRHENDEITTNSMKQPNDDTQPEDTTRISTNTTTAAEELPTYPYAQVISPYSKSPPAAILGQLHEFAPKIVVAGVGGAGGNAINNMIAKELKGVDFVALNTDAQHLSTTLTDQRLQLGVDLTRGLGCGANPDAGRLAAEECRDQIQQLLQEAHMVFITAGMGGGTGTGAAPVVADICYQMGILTVGVVTLPFSFEGTQRKRLALEGIARLQDVLDTLIVIPNQNLFQLANQHTSFVEAFAMADDVLLGGVKSITDLMTAPGLINLDFADVQSVMHGMGNALLGTGVASGEDRAMEAAKMALNNPLLGSDMDIATAKGMLVNITGGKDMTLFEVDKAAQCITERVHDESANIIFGSAYDETLEGSIRVSVVATGIDRPGTW